MILIRLLYYTIYNEKHFQKVSFCVITHPIGQNRMNGRPCAKNMVTMELAGDARGAKRRALGAAGRPAIEHEYSLGASRPSA